MVGFSDVVTPQNAPAPAPDQTTVVPPRTPEELQARTVGWQGFLTRLQTDPAMQRAAVHAASQLAQGPGYGQSTWGHLAQAYEGATNAYDFEKQNEKAQAAAEAKAALEGQRTQQVMAASAQEQAGKAVDTATRQAEEARKVAGQPSVIRKTEAEAAKAEAEAKNIPEKLALDLRVQKASLAAHQAVAEAAKKNPTMQAAQTQFDLWGQSSEGAKKPAETEEAWKMRGWDVVRAQTKNANAGVEQQNRQLQIKTLLEGNEEDRAQALQMAREDAMKTSGHTPPPAASTGLKDKNGRPYHINPQGKAIYD